MRTRETTSMKYCSSVVSFELRTCGIKNGIADDWGAGWYIGIVSEFCLEAVGGGDEGRPCRLASCGIGDRCISEVTSGFHLMGVE